MFGICCCYLVDFFFLICFMSAGVFSALVSLGEERESDPLKLELSDG